MGGSISKNKSSSRAQNSSKESVWGPQGNALGNMYNQAANTFADNKGYQGIIDQQATDLDPYMQNVMNNANQGYENQMQGGSYGDTGEIRDRLMQSMDSMRGGSETGKMYNSIVGGEGNTYIDPMVDAMKRGAMDNNARMQSGTAMDAAAMGQGGSSRHAMQNAMTNQMSNRDMMDKESMMRGGAYDKDLAMKMDIANKADLGVQNTQDRYMNMLAGADANQRGAMDFGSQMQNLGMGSMAPAMQASQVPWDNMNQYANAIGGPTVLGESSGSSRGKSSGFGASASIKG